MDGWGLTDSAPLFMHIICSEYMYKFTEIAGDYVKMVSVVVYLRFGLLGFLQSRQSGKLFLQSSELGLPQPLTRR